MKKILSVGLVVLMIFSCFSIISFAEESADHLTEVPEGYVGVYTKDDLDYIKLNMSGKYILMNDIVFEDSDFEKGGDFYNSGKGWEPIGTSSTNFQGTFDGNGYTIENLYINAPEQDYIGLFGYVCNATITKINLKSINIVGKSFVGGIAGHSYLSTTISYCNAQGYVSGENNVGGIVGYQNASYSSSNSIQYCNNAADVFATSNTGGVVGFSYADRTSQTIGVSRINYCSNSGDVTATSSNAGGIIGQAVAEGYYDYHYHTTYINVKCSYNCSNITAPSYAGGLIGKTEHTNVTHCYSVGVATAESDFGGCFGNTPYSTTFCYYLDEGVANPTCTSGTPKSEDQLKKASSYEQWDFNTVWTMSGREDYPYPELIDVPLILPEDSQHKHEYTYEVTTPETHLAEGVMTYTCSCGDTYTEVIEKTADHNYNAAVTSPTCTKQGFTTYTCECGDSYIDDYIDANGHREGEWVVTKPATTTSTGTKTQNCSVCGELLATEIIPMLPSKVHSVLVSGVSLDYKSTGTIATAINADVGAKYTVTYSSSNSSVVSVDANGNVIAGKTGSATITCIVTDSYGNVVSDTCEVEVKYNWWQWIIVIVLFGWIWY